MRSTFTFLFSLTLCLLQTGLSAQLVADFEALVTDQGEFYNGSDGATSFISGGIELPVDFQDFGTFTAWSGFAISSVVNPDEGGFGNQYASRSGSGAENSDAYAVAFAGGSAVMHLTEEVAGEPVLGMSITNSAYAYFSMLEGDDFAKAFGGETGDDPDYFLLTIHGYLGGQLTTDSVDFYLADYRFDNNDLDYIVEDWNFVDLSGLGPVDSLLFQLSSTDNNAGGMLTPAYFCMDNVITASPNSLANEVAMPELKVYPNPTADLIRFSSTDGLTGNYQLTNLQGQQLVTGQFIDQIELRHLPAGTYTLLLESEAGWLSRKLIRK